MLVMNDNFCTSNTMYTYNGYRFEYQWWCVIMWLDVSLSLIQNHSSHGDTSSLIPKLLLIISIHSFIVFIFKHILSRWIILYMKWLLVLMGKKGTLQRINMIAGAFWNMFAYGIYQGNLFHHLFFFMYFFLFIY